MATSDPLMPMSEGGKTPQVYHLDDPKSEAQYAKDSEAVHVNTTSKSIGLTKEQLEQYRTDPFWKPMRIILFILFWVAWIGMFAGAVVIVVMSPKCPEKKQPNWYKSKVSYQAWIPAFRDSDGDGQGDLKGMDEKLEKLRKAGVQTLWPTPVIESSGFSYGVTDFKKVDEKLGSLDDFKALINDAHDKEMKLIMDLPISTTSLEHQWFVESAKGAAEFADYYIWRSSAPSGQEAFWAKPDGSSKYYLHYEDKKHWPVLNWGNEQVHDKILDAAKFWLDTGVDGFYVGFVDYLARNDDGSEADWDKSIERLSKLVSDIRTYSNDSADLTDKDITLFSSLKKASNAQKRALVAAGLNYVINTELTEISADSCKGSTVAPCLHKTLSDILPDHDDVEDLHPMWELGTPFVSRLATRVKDRQVAELLTFVQLLLPGAVNIHYGDEIGMTDLKTSGANGVQNGFMQWDSTDHAGATSAQTPLIGIDDSYKEVNFDAQYAIASSPLKTFKKLAKLRLRDETLMLGDFKLGKLHDSDSFAFSRAHWNGNSTVGHIYVGVVNFGNKEEKISWKDENLYRPSANLAKAEVVIATSNDAKHVPRQSIDLSEESHTIGPKQGIVFRFTS